MAEFVLKDMVKKAGREKDFLIESAATSTEEIGNRVYPPARRKLAEHGISCEGKTARQMRINDYRDFDLFIPEMSLTRSIRATLRQPGAMWRKAVGNC